MNVSVPSWLELWYRFVALCRIRFHELAAKRRPVALPRDRRREVVAGPPRAVATPAAAASADEWTPVPKADWREYLKGIEAGTFDAGDLSVVYVSSTNWNPVVLRYSVAPTIGSNVR